MAHAFPAVHNPDGPAKYKPMGDAIWNEYQVPGHLDGFTLFEKATWDEITTSSGHLAYQDVQVDFIRGIIAKPTQEFQAAGTTFVPSTRYTTQHIFVFYEKDNPHAGEIVAVMTDVVLVGHYSNGSEFVAALEDFLLNFGV